MPNYLTPGIYVEEVASGPRPIEAVGTSTMGAVGIAAAAENHVNECKAIRNWSEYVRLYGKDGAESTYLDNAVRGFFINGGSFCYVVNVGKGGSLVGSKGKKGGLEKLEEIDEIAIVIAPGFTSAKDYEHVLTHCENCGDRVAILDSEEEVDDLTMLLKVKTVAESSSKDKVKARSAGKGLKPRQSTHGTFYFPWVFAADAFEPSKTISMPPSGHIAGLWARNDAERGVQKAPANAPLRGVIGLKYNITRAEQGPLNKEGVNCIRSFTSEGIRVWGARTLAGGASEWRYVPVRRLFNMIEESIAEGTRYVVFEPNNETLWQNIRRDIGAFLTVLWRNGALMGSTPEEAFYVKCDSETNPPEVIDAGQVVAEVGIAPLKPAEFVIIRISQYQSASLEEN